MPPGKVLQPQKATGFQFIAVFNTQLFVENRTGVMAAKSQNIGDDQNP
jgi:hypothetical protein